MKEISESWKERTYRDFKDGGTDRYRDVLQEAEEETNISGAAELTFSSISFQNIPDDETGGGRHYWKKRGDRKYGRIT